MTASPALLDINGFAARSLMPSADIDVVAGVIWKKIAVDDLPATQLAEQLVGQLRVTGSIVAVTIRPTTGLTSDAVDYATVIVSKRTGNGAPVTIADLSTTAVDWTASVPVVVPIVAGAVTAGDQLTVQIVKVNAGVVVPAFTIAVIPSPSFIDFTLARCQSWLYARLRKRYAIPFDPTNPPDVFLNWLVALTDPIVYSKRGLNPSDSMRKTIDDARTEALADVKEAADSDVGLFDLPLLNDEAVSAIAEGGPYGYSEFLPETWTDQQVRNAIQNGEICDIANPGFELIS